MNMKAMTLTFAVVFALLSSLMIGTPAFANSDRIVGVWNVTEEILTGCPTGDVARTSPDLVMFTRGGDLIETPGALSVGQEPIRRTSPGLGSWEHAGGRHFTIEFRFFRYNDADDTPAGVHVIKKNIELSRDGDEFTSTGTADIFDATGAFVTTRCTAGSATRIK